MLNLFKLNTKKLNKNKPVNIEKDKNYYKYYPVSTREWNNSIYVFDKSSLGLIPQATISALRLIKSSLNIYNSILEGKIRTTRYPRRTRRLSSTRVYVGNGGFKHTNDKVIITIFTHNRQKSNYLSLLDKIGFYQIIPRLNKLFYRIKRKGLKYLKKNEKEKYIAIKKLNMLYIAKNKDKYKSLYINDFTIKFYKKWVNKSLQKIKIYFYIKQLLYINKSRYKYTYLETLQIYVEKIYNKKVEFNLINLKYHYLNSDIISQSLTLKIEKNRRRISSYLRKLIWKVKTYKTFYSEPNLNKLNLIKNINDPIENLLDNKSIPDVESLKKVVLKEIKHKRLGGVRVEASGRLTRRNTASRAVLKLRYKGNLMNVDSSYKGLSTVILKGNLRSNLQYNKLKSKTRIGSFCIKTWVSGI